MRLCPPGAAQPTKTVGKKMSDLIGTKSTFEVLFPGPAWASGWEEEAVSRVTVTLMIPGINKT